MKEEGEEKEGQRAMSVRASLRSSVSPTRATSAGVEPGPKRQKYRRSGQSSRKTPPHERLVTRALNSTSTAEDGRFLEMKNTRADLDLLERECEMPCETSEWSLFHSCVLH